MWTLCLFKNCVFWRLVLLYRPCVLSVSIAFAWDSADTVMDRNGGSGWPCLVLILKTVFLTVLCLK